ncbi:MAG: hypothetical protein HY392_03390 [Candidatus Diapherotrites archaeon]|nr:hypothetical protein [Candidatus Diapherotrites archaeon]
MKTENNFLFIALFGLLAGVFVLNFFLQAQLSEKLGDIQATGLANATQNTGVQSQSIQQNQPVAAQPTMSPQEQAALLAEIIPKGAPPVYGEELGITFDDPERAIVVLSKLDGGWTKLDQSIWFKDLGDQEKSRYIKIGSSIACEFCCGANTLITKEGEAACGCAHSAAMRGLAKYLLKNHAGEFSDEQILEEITKVKTLSFPKQMVERAIQLKGQGKSIYEVTQSLPSQVGGC